MLKFDWNAENGLSLDPGVAKDTKLATQMPHE
mgnify:CR=1 FL=1